MTTISVTVRAYSDAASLGRVEIDAAEWARYEACDHPAYQWPEGIARAGDVLTDEQIERMGITSRTVVYLD